MAWREQLCAEWGIVAIVIVFIALAGTYSIVTPLFEAPDELNHFFYVKHLADGNPLPIQDPDEVGLWAQEGSQPPLYYALGALVISPVDTSDALDVLWPNQHANLGDPLQPGNKNRVVHTDAEAWPYQGLVLAVHIVRWLSVLMGAGTVYLTYRLAKDLLPGREGLALAAAAFVAAVPQFAFISGAVTNDNLIILLSTLALWLLLRILQGEAKSHTFAFLGIVVGLAALSKLSGAGLWPLTAFILIVHAIRERSWRALWREGAVVFGLAVAIAGWWYVRNWLLYGEPTGLERMLDVVGRRAAATNGLQVLSELEGLRISFWGLFGWFNIPLPRWIYKVLDGVSLAAVAGLLLGVLRQSRGRVPTVLWWLLLPSAWLTLLFAGLARWTHLTPATQGRLLFPAISAVAILITLGWSQWVPKGWRPAWWGVLLLPLFALSVASPFVFIRPAYVHPTKLAPNEVPREAFLGTPRTFRLRRDVVRLLGAEVSPGTVHPGESVELVLYWEALNPIPLDLTLFVHLLGRGLEQEGGLDTYPGWGAYPTRLWQPGEIIEDRYLVPVDHDAAAPSRLLVDVGLYYEPTNVGLTILGPDGEPASGVIGEIRLVLDERPEYLSQYATDFHFADKVALSGYDLTTHTVQPGESFAVTLYWQALAPMELDYTAFVHMVDAEEQIVTQDDKPPLEGDWPTSAWQPGETVPDVYELAVPPDTAVGTYQLRAGLYLLADRRRLPVTGEPGRVVANSVILDEISITLAESRAR